jgi:hypothetical protein
LFILIALSAWLPSAAGLAGISFAPYGVKNIELAVGQNVNVCASLAVAGTATAVNKLRVI